MKSIKQQKNTNQNQGEAFSRDGTVTSVFAIINNGYLHAPGDHNGITLAMHSTNKQRRHQSVAITKCAATTAVLVRGPTTMPSYAQ